MSLKQHWSHQYHKQQVCHLRDSGRGVSQTRVPSGMLPAFMDGVLGWFDLEGAVLGLKVVTEAMG